MSRRDALLLLSAIWGASFLFIKLGVDVLEPSVVALGRVVFGALLLLALLPGRGGLARLRGHLVPLVVLGALNNAVPFWLLGFAEKSLDSGLTAIIQAAAPIFTVILASRVDVSQRVSGTRLLGVVVGFVGVALLVGVQAGGDLVAAFAVIGVALCYAGSVLYAGRTMRGVPALQVSSGNSAVPRCCWRRSASCSYRRRCLPPRSGSPYSPSGALGSGIASSSTSRSSRVRARPAPSRDLPRARVRGRLRRPVPRRGHRHVIAARARPRVAGTALATGVVQRRRDSLRR